MSSVKILLFKGKKLSSGEHPIVIQIIKDRNRKVIGIGRSCLPALWDDKNNIPKKQHPNYLQLTSFITKRLKEARDVHNVLETEKGDSYSIEEFIKKIKNTRKKTTVFSFTDEIIADFLKIGKVGNAKVYRDTKRELIKFRAGKDLEFTDVDEQFLRKWEQQFRERQFKENTISVYFRTFRSIYNKAIKENYVKHSDYPFREFKVSKFNTTTVKRALPENEIRAILNFVPESDLLQAHNFFLFSFYTRGMNFHDMAKLKWTQIKGDRLFYIRAKTGKQFQIKILPPVERILNYYKNLQTNSYVFPILDDQIHTTANSQYNRIKKVLRSVNKDFKEIGRLLRIETLLTTYVVRHSWATSLKRKGVSTSIISEGLGHDSEETTQTYLDSFGNDVLDQANESLLTI